MDSKERKYGVFGQLSETSRTYDDLGNITAESLPYDPNNDTPIYLSREYDEMFRIVKQEVPQEDGTSRYMTMEYTDLTAVSTNPRGQRVSQTFNSYGQLLKRVENDGTEMKFCLCR